VNNLSNCIEHQHGWDRINTSFSEQRSRGLSRIYIRYVKGEKLDRVCVCLDQFSDTRAQHRVNQNVGIQNNQGVNT
jgi:hypothetical protein